MTTNRIVRYFIAAILGAACGIFSVPPAAEAAKWWNPFNWFESSEQVRAETARYKSERPDYLLTLDEARGTGDPQTIRQARQELRDFDKAHAKRIKALRKESHQQMRLAHKGEHRLKKAGRKSVWGGRTSLRSNSELEIGRFKTPGTTGRVPVQENRGRGKSR